MTDQISEKQTETDFSQPKCNGSSQITLPAGDKIQKQRDVAVGRCRRLPRPRDCTPVSIQGESPPRQARDYLKKDDCQCGWPQNRTSLSQETVDASITMSL
ncbi:MAG: hypothetical protein MK110_06470 [Fuerstiella sp.]|nr:hypothetical protein [Fuerstiella sp.]